MEIQAPNGLISKLKRKSYHWLQAHEKQAIISDASMGMAQKDIAAKYGISRETIRRVIKDFKESCPQAELSKDLSHYREKLKGKAITAVETGLDDPTDSYKRGNLGVQVLNGLGEFTGDAPAGSSLNILLANMPPSIFNQLVSEGAIELVSDEQEAILAEVEPNLLLPAGQDEPEEPA